MHRSTYDIEARAAAGEPDALYALGLRLLGGEGAGRDPRRGVRAIQAAAAQEHRQALITSAVFSIMGIDSPPSWNAALNLVRRAAELGDQSAVRQLALIGADAAFDIARAAAIPPARGLLDSPRLIAIERFIPPEWCDWLIERASPLRAAATMYAPDGPRATQGRTNTDALFRPEHSDLVLELINARISRSMGLPVSHQEYTHVLHYEVGQEFKPHYDFIDARHPFGARDIEQHGQRVATLLVYLNDDYEGGETLFLQPNLRHKGAKGDALLFFNVVAGGAPDVTTRHAGLAPTRGEKWLLSKWVRSRPLALL